MAVSNHNSDIVPAGALQDIEEYREWIRKFRAREIGDIKMQKIRLQLGTYAQRQDGVQMERIKFPGGRITGSQLKGLADAADEFANGFIHFTTRQDGQLYYIQLEKCPDLLLALAQNGITTREACGNTVRNITAGYDAGTSPKEPFDVTPYCEALFRFLVRNKFNQVMGRKIKLAFDGSGEDEGGMLIHDIGFQAAMKDGKRGFRIFVGGGLGATPMLGHLYTEFLPEEKMLQFGAAIVRLFDRYGERRNRMAARMKYLVKKLGWDEFKKRLDEELNAFELPESANDYLKEAHKEQQAPAIANEAPEVSVFDDEAAYGEWLQDNVKEHKLDGFKGVVIRLKLGDLLTDPARKIASLAEEYFGNEIRITKEQNLFLPWVPEKALGFVYQQLKELGLNEAGANTLRDATTCPGADTCRLGITSAKGLGAAVNDAFNNGLGRFKELASNITMKVSGCPNGCAQHGIANIGFQGAALKKDGRSIPVHELFIGGQLKLDGSRFGERFGKYPAKNGPKIVEKLLELYQESREGDESFGDCMVRVGRDKIKELLSPLEEIPDFESAPDFYEDWGHDNEKFATRTGIKGECAGAPVQEKSPTMEDAKEAISQTEALIAHSEWDAAQAKAYESVALVVRVALYANLVDPFTSEQAIWEFENIFALAGEVDAEWVGVSERTDALKEDAGAEQAAADLLEIAKKLIPVSEQLQEKYDSLNPAKKK